MFLDPSNIMLIARSYGGFNPTPGMNEEQKNEVINSHSQHTVIWFSTGGSALVMEEPDIIAILRERACNNPTGPRAVGGGE